ncbi:MAG: hypothetical protein R3B90_22105 [Planctomycetaceae bacterium]
MWYPLQRLVLALLICVCCGCDSSNDGYRGFSPETDERPESAGEVVPPNQGRIEAISQNDRSTESPDSTSVTATREPVNATESAPAAGIAADAPDDSETYGAAPWDTTQPRPVPLPQRIADIGADGQFLSSATTFFNTSSQPVEDAPREITLLVKERTFAKVDPDDALLVTYDDLDLLKVLNMQPVPPDAVDHFPDWLKGLDGKMIRLKGFMMPTLRSSGLPGFTLARDNQICCFGRYPMVYDIIPVVLKDGVTTNYIQNRPFDVVGRFAIRPDLFRGEWQNIYEIEDAIIIE